jgi:hypothetical protein
MAGSPPKPPPPTFAAGSSSPKPPPPTFNSHPSYEELMDSYLRHRVVSGTKVGFIHEADLYSADPYQLTQITCRRLREVGRGRGTSSRRCAPRAPPRPK